MEFNLTMRLRTSTMLVVLPLLFALVNNVLVSVSEAEIISLGPSKDNTLINNGSGSVSNGTGFLFAGKTGNSGPGALRALLAFDIASEIPAGATITDVQMTLTVLQAGNGSNNDSYGLHRVAQDWGEGKSFASGGNGAPSENNDATWIHTFFNSSFWTNPGGDFEGTPSATETVGSSGTVTWGSTSEMVANVQNWLNDPSSNFGWILIGNEASSASARRFGSREST
ncbi:MAG: DNRLRE domain-containing protein, partial [Planctomycetes bacterium]|nr:DNRLRE domain-containing protein [Planctomycetota bacterium]